ncbi:hypothetical protein HDU85_002584 [Gaertneriomyces sp. JEL0708]|nr:hypothetical protein HDU85_002584 [Gaertneriomyces sp. JEL0708]
MSAAAPRTDYFAYTYASLVLAGGIIGFIKAGSITSLIAGTVTGTLLGIGAKQVSGNPKQVLLLLAVSLLLMLVMGKRWNGSGKFMPAGMVTLMR